jgi:quercetin dioxygenase-like cupin family protein
MTTQHTLKLIRPGEGKTISVNGGQIIFKVAVDEGNTAEASLIEIMTPPGGGAPLHRHGSETFYVHAGSFEFFGAQPEETLQATAGDYIHIAPGVAHGYKNVGETRGRLLIVTVSAWFQHFLEDLAAIEGPLDMKKMVSVGQKHGIEMLG